jgi:excisionase family DNA binding protein
MDNIHGPAETHQDESGRGSQLLFTAEQAAASLAICRTKVYELLRMGELDSVQIGASRRIPAAALAEYVERLRTRAKVPSSSWMPQAGHFRRPRCD